AHHGLRLAVVKRPDAIAGFVLLPRRWLVERSLGWMARFRRRARHFERLADTLVGLPYVAFALLMVRPFVNLAIPPTAPRA
ncbi:MAG TPA: transposase, partial [Aggregatilineales bacterium]|nr:transposase [Aggregatilineales bacterium]